MTLSCGQCAVDMGLSFQDPQRGAAELPASRVSGLQLEQRWQLPEAACALAAAALPGVVALAGPGILILPSDLSLGQGNPWKGRRVHLHSKPLGD